MKRFRFACVALALAIGWISTPAGLMAATLSFAPPFSDHMVLQRDQPLRVWGKAAAGEKVSVTVAGKQADATADASGAWRATLPAIAAGGPFELVASTDGASVKLADVLVGDVWLCSGQSNMQFKLKEALGSAGAMATAAADPRLRLLLVPSHLAAEPTEQLDAHWAIATEKSAADFSAVGIFFALALHRSSPALRDVPIGMIDSTLGGSRVEYWIPPEPDAPKPATQAVSFFNVKPSQLYNAMIRPLAGLNLKGVLWYQGESDAPKPGQYADLLLKMIHSWRSDFQNSELPFLLVQLPNYPEPIEKYSFAWLREAQTAVTQKDAHTKMAITLGTPDGYDLHPKHKQLVGDRLALLARRYAYGEGVAADSPSFKAASIEGQSIRVTFDTHGSPLRADPEGLADFEIAGRDGVFWSAAAKLDGDDAVIVHSDAVSEPAFVRYAWQAAPHATLTNAAGLPAGPFRTDSAVPRPMFELQEIQPPRRLLTDHYTAMLDPGGWLIGLMVDGHQMLNVNPFGGLVPLSGFGPYKLPTSVQSSSTQIAFTDTNWRFTYHFEPDAVRVELHNGFPDGKSSARCMLSNDLTIDKPFVAGQPAAFSFRNARLVIDGFDSCRKSLEGNYDLQVEVPAGMTKTIVFHTGS